MVRLVCCDLDNTLLFDKNGAVPGELFGLIEKLSHKGVLFAVVSGRPVADLLRLFAPVIDKIVIAAYDGAVVLYKGEAVVSRPIDKNIYMAFIESVNNESSGLGAREYIFYTLTDAYVSGNSVFAEKALLDSVTMTGRIIRTGTPGEITEPVYKLSLLSGEGNDDFDYVVRDWSSYLNNIYTGTRWCEFVSADTDKGYAVNLLMERFGISAAETMAFGDGINDIGMLSACDFSYAMESSVEEVKQSASFVTDNVIRSIKEFFSM